MKSLVMSVNRNAYTDINALYTYKVNGAITNEYGILLSQLAKYYRAASGGQPIVKTIVEAVTTKENKKLPYSLSIFCTDFLKMYKNYVEQEDRLAKDTKEPGHTVVRDYSTNFSNVVISNLKLMRDYESYKEEEVGKGALNVSYELINAVKPIMPNSLTDEFSLLLRNIGLSSLLEILYLLNKKFDINTKYSALF